MVASFSAQTVRQDYQETSIGINVDGRSFTFTASEYQAIQAVKKPGCNLTAEMLVIEAKEVSGLIAPEETQSWQYAGQTWVGNMLVVTNQWNDSGFKKYGRFDSSICIGYVLNFVAMNSILGNEFSWSKNKQNPARLAIKDLLKDQKWHECVYAWLKPALKLVWATFSPELKDFYRGTIKYVRSLNYEAEKKYYGEVLKAGQEWKFCGYEPNGKYDPRRKAKTWFFRRMYFDGWSWDYCLAWLEKIEKEIMI
jgi:hypothetical protein